MYILGALSLDAGGQDMCTIGRISFQLMRHATNWQVTSVALNMFSHYLRLLRRL